MMYVYSLGMYLFIVYMNVYMGTQVYFYVYVYVNVYMCIKTF